MAPSSSELGIGRESGRHRDSDLAVPFTLQLSRALSSADCNPVVAGTNAAFGLLGDNKAAVGFFSFAGHAGLLAWVDR